MEKILSKKKNPAAVALGRMGGLARARSITPEQASAIAKKAVEARILRQQAAAIACVRCLGKHGCTTRRVLGATLLCDLCARITTMRGRAKLKKKYAPTAEEVLPTLTNPDMKCPICLRKMVLHWRLRDKKSVATLQHWDDGTWSIICFSCNARHAGFAGNRDERLRAHYAHLHDPTIAPSDLDKISEAARLLRTKPKPRWMKNPYQISAAALKAYQPGKVGRPRKGANA